MKTKTQFTESVKRSLKSSLSDDGVTLGVAEQDAETAGIAKNLIARLTVRDPAKVPPVSYLDGAVTGVTGYNAYASTVSGGPSSNDLNAPDQPELYGQQRPTRPNLLLCGYRS